MPAFLWCTWHWPRYFKVPSDFLWGSPDETTGCEGLRAFFGRWRNKPRGLAVGSHRTVSSLESHHHHVLSLSGLIFDQTDGQKLPHRLSLLCFNELNLLRLLPNVWKVRFPPNVPRLLATFTKTGCVCSHTIGVFICSSALATFGGAAFCGPFPLVSALFGGRNGVFIARAIRMARHTVSVLVIWFCVLLTL